jgi:hypothetical protein
MSEHIKAYFEKIHNQLKRLEKKYNPNRKDLHFANEAIPKVDDKLFYNLLKLSGKAIDIIKDEQNHYSNKTAYAHVMFDFWYDYFLLISSASIRINTSANSNDYPQETIYNIIEDLINISEFSTIVSGDLYFRNHEALGNTLLAFYSVNLMNFLKNKKKLITSESMKDFLDGTIKDVKKYMNKRK